MNIKFEFLGNDYYCATNKDNKITYDPLLLADFAKASEHHLDMCCGNGIIALLMHKKGCQNVTGIDINKEAIELANLGKDKSNCDIDFIHGDVRDISKLIDKESFDSITVNPPYFSDGMKSENSRRNEIRSEIFLTLDECLNAAFFALKKEGCLYLCHRYDRRYEVKAALRKAKFHLKLERYVADSADKNPFLVMYAATKKKRGAAFMLDLILKINGEYTPEARRIFFPKRND